MSTKDDGGLAFACANDHGYQGGMSLRDWFAGMALSNPAICTGMATEYELRNWFGGRGGITQEEVAARQAIAAADAMIAEGKKDV